MALDHNAPRSQASRARARDRLALANPASSGGTGSLLPHHRGDPCVQVTVLGDAPRIGRFQRGVWRYALDTLGRCADNVRRFSRQRHPGKPSGAECAAVLAGGQTMQRDAEDGGDDGDPGARAGAAANHVR